MTENKRFELAYEKGNWGGGAVRDGDITLWNEETIALYRKYDLLFALLW